MALSRELTVGEVARRSGVSVSTLHFYERKGLIVSARSRGNQRRYRRAVLRRIAVIRVGQRAGIALGEIAEALAGLPEDGQVERADWQRLSARWRASLDARIARLEALRDAIAGCIGCGCLSLEDCPLRNPDDRLGSHGAGPRLIDPQEADG